MKKLFDRIFHSDNLAISCIKRFFVLLCVWLWNVGALYSLYTYPPMYIYTKLKYEAESLAVHTVFFFIAFSAICMVDAFWVKESRDKNILRYIAKLIIPMLPFLIICPVLYVVYPDKNLCNIFLAIQWLPVIVTDSVLWGSIITGGVVVVLAIIFFVIPFYLLPKISAVIGKIAEKNRFRYLKNKYLNRKKINANILELFAEDDGDLSVHLESVCVTYNEDLKKYFADSNVCRDGVKKVGIYFTEKRANSIEVGVAGVFAVVNVRSGEDENKYDVNLLADKCVCEITDILRKILTDAQIEDTEKIIEHLLKTADAFYPKNSGLKRL